MSLPTSQQRILDGIEDGLRAHDLRLASLFATFTRLTRQEEMPRVEQLKPGGAMGPLPGSLRRPGLLRWRVLPRPAGAKRPLGAVRIWRTGRPADGTPWITFLPIVLVAALSALVLGLLVSAHQGTCAAGGSSLSAASSVSRSTGCPVRHVPNARH